MALISQPPAPKKPSPIPPPKKSDPSLRWMSKADVLKKKREQAEHDAKLKAYSENLGKAQPEAPVDPKPKKTRKKTKNSE